MSDIIERLRRRWDEDCKLAADEIERLRAEVSDWRQAARVEANLRREFLARAEKAEAEVERLLARIAELERKPEPELRYFGEIPL